MPEPDRVELDRPGAATKLVPTTGTTAPAEAPSLPEPTARRPPAAPPAPYAGLNKAERRLVAWLRDNGLSWDTFCRQCEAGRWPDVDYEVYEGVGEAYLDNSDLKEFLDHVDG